jgi:hypothetical protein
MSKQSTTRRLAFLLSRNSFPGVSTGDAITRLDLPPGTEVGRRFRDLRKAYPTFVQRWKDGRFTRYFVPVKYQKKFRKALEAA